MRNFRQRKAFTIVEMVIVIAVIAVLAAVMIPTISGVIKKANHSADTQFAASLSMQLATWEADPANGVIDSEEKLREAIEAFYDADFYDTLAPKSGKEGYHYWYDVESKKVILATCDELNMGRAIGDYTFSPASPRSLILGGKNYFLMDKSGSDLAELINSFEILDEADAVSAFEAALQNLYTIANQNGSGSIEEQILNKVKMAAIITEHGAFRYEDLSAVEGVYIPATVKTLVSTKVYTYSFEGNTAEVNDTPATKVIDSVVEFALPAGVTVNTNGLVGFAPDEDETEYKTNTPTVLVSDNDLGTIFFGYATDCVIQTPDGNRYVIKYNASAGVYQYCKLPDGEPAGDLETGGVSADDTVEIGYTHVTNQMVYDPSGKVLYVAYDEGGVQLKVTDPTMASMATWSVPNNDFFTIDNNGKVTFKEMPAANEDEPFAMVKASVPVVGGGEIGEFIKIYVCRINEARFSVDRESISLPAIDASATEVTIVYEEKNEFDISGLNLGYNGFNPQDIAITFPNAKLTATLGTALENVGNLFEIDENCTKLTVNVDNIDDYAAKNKGQTVTFQYSVGDTVYAVETYTIKVFDNSSKAFEVKKGPDGAKLSENYLYRVGNSGTITLGQLFENSKPTDKIVVEIIDIADGEVAASANANVKTLGATYTADASNWENGTIQFTGTGIATVKISTVKTVDGNDVIVATTPVNLEIVDGKNYNEGATISAASNIVLHGDVTLASGTITLNGKSFYGNGYTFNVTAGTNTGAGDDYNGLVILIDSVLDNVKILGPQYTSFGITAKVDNVRATVLAKGNSNIYNCYISNGMAPVRTAGGSEVRIEDTTLWGGSFANLDIRGGDVTVKNLTTFNQVVGNPDPKQGSIGMGIVLWYENMPQNTKLTIEGTLTQYNNISDDHVKDETYFTGTCKSFAESMLKQTAYKNGKWINAGIMSTNKDYTGYVTNATQYSTTNITVKIGNYSGTGAFWGLKPSDELVAAQPPEWKPEAQHIIEPTATPNYKNEGNEGNYVAPEDGSNEYCYFDEGSDQLLISFTEGGSKEFNPWILNATKHGFPLPYNVTIDGVSYAKNETITFNSTGTHTLVFTYEDPYNYAVKDGALDKTNLTYTYTVTISVTAVKKNAKPAEFTFYGYTGVSKTAASTFTSTTKTGTSGKVWVMPSASSGTGVATTTIDGITVNVPIVHVDFKDNSSDFNWLYPIFLGVQIVDYADGGTGAAKTVVSPTSTSKPNTITIITEDKPTAGGGWSSGSGKSGSAGVISCDSTRKTYKGLYGWTSGALGSDQSAGSIVAQFTYTSEKGDVYYYAIKFQRAAHTCPSSCVTGDTLVTLADGTQKEIQYVTYEDYLLVWNHFDGKYEVVPAAIIFNHGYDNNTVIKLNFSDGTQVKMINLHQFLDADLKQYVTITADTVAQYVGHNFVKQNGEGYTTVILESYEISEEYIEAYGIISALHYNILVEGMFSTDFMEQDYDLFNYFTIGEGMVYDAEQMQEDIEKYGLYTYEDFADYLTYEQFVGFNVQYFKIAVGRGLYTYEGILNLIDEYLNA